MAGVYAFRSLLGKPYTEDQATDGQAGGPSGNGEVKGSITTERRDLLTLYASGKIPQVDGAGVLATPAGLFERAGIDPGDVAHRLMAMDTPGRWA